MKIKILKVQISHKPILETKLSINGHISDATLHDEQSYEMIVYLYRNEIKSILDKTIIVSERHYDSNISKYGMESLLKGVEISSLFEVAEEHSGDDLDHYKKEVELIAYSIIAKVKQEAFFDPEKLKNYIEIKLLSLKDKFDIEPK